MSETPAVPPNPGKKPEKKVKEVKPPPPGGYEKKPQLTKAERRELQEKQRAEKSKAKEAAQKQGGGSGNSSSKSGSGGGASSGPSKRTSDSSSAGSVDPKTSELARPKHLFAHLAPYSPKTSSSLGAAAWINDAHPAVVALGLRYANGAVRGADARCVAMLEAMKCVVNDFVTPPGKAFERELDKKIDRSFQFLTDCRPHSVSMGNAKQHLRGVIRSLDSALPVSEAKEQVCDEVDRFVRERVEAAGRLIAEIAVGKVRDSGDVLLTFGRSHVVEQVLLLAHACGKQFHVVVVDARPSLEGKGLLERLTAAGVSCTYCWLNALSYAMPSVTKVLLGAAAVLSNGAVQARAGTALVAMTAATRNVPVIFTCETYKLCEKVFLDSVVSNELGDPAELALPKHADGGFPALSAASSASSQSSPSAGGDSAAGSGAGKGGGEVRFLNLRYDLTPIKFVGFVVTEVGMIPPTAVPALLREYRREASAENPPGTTEF